MHATHHTHHSDQQWSRWWQPISRVPEHGHLAASTETGEERERDSQLSHLTRRATGVVTVRSFCPTQPSRPSDPTFSSWAATAITLATQQAKDLQEGVFRGQLENEVRERGNCRPRPRLAAGRQKYTFSQPGDFNPLHLTSAVLRR